jgi:hypothetical protein
LHDAGKKVGEGSDHFCSLIVVIKFVIINVIVVQVFVINSAVVYEFSTFSIDVLKPVKSVFFSYNYHYVWIKDLGQAFCIGGYICSW